jgi:succinate dehydrogenase/fumarate reductase flavoprotein subunit
MLSSGLLKSDKKNVVIIGAGAAGMVSRLFFKMRYVF